MPVERKLIAILRLADGLRTRRIWRLAEPPPLIERLPLPQGQRLAPTYDLTMHRSAPEIQSDIDTLEEFIDAYRYYFGAPDEKGDVPTEFVGNRATLRQLILRKTGPVEAIMERLGTNGIGVLPPPAVGGPGLHGLSAVAFADEQYLYKNASPPLHQSVLDAVERSIGLLQHELKGQGRSPFPPLSSSSTSAHRPRYPRLILGRVLRHVPGWAALIERFVLFAAAIAAIVGVLGTALGWWSDPTP